MVKRSRDELEAISAGILAGAGASLENARIVARHLVDATMCGHSSHGVLRLSQYCNAIEQGEVAPCARATVVVDHPAGAVMNGNCAFGQVGANDAMGLAIEKAAKGSVAAVTLRNSYHSGRLGAYSKMAAEAGMIGLVMVNAGGGGQTVAPFGGLDRRLATNPFSIAAPSRGGFDPMLDVATSMAPEGKVRDFYRRGIALPSDWIIDADGNSTTDAAKFYGPQLGALLPWGTSVGHKGFGLAFMIDILAGALSGAGCCGPENVPASDGILFIAIDVAQFVNMQYFYDQIDKLIQHVKSSRRAKGFEDIYAPGELEYREAERQLKFGVEIDDPTWREIETLAERYGVSAQSTNGRPEDSRIAPPHTPALTGREMAGS